ncbi:hypothetical protein V6N11_070438 [Hibiscus sabdariffa]|uniref:Uncharacterized protein n=1 Tax=Hibiscus sabdariffa TaxID=183260 RepID=A0ABR2QEZ1_9ROSI
MSLHCAIDLDIPDIIKKQAHADAHYRVDCYSPEAPPHQGMQHLPPHAHFTSLRLFAQQKLGDGATNEGGYVLTHASCLLLKDNPLRAEPLLKVMLDRILVQPKHFLGTYFQNNNCTPFVTAHGKMLWDYCGHDPWVNNSFNEVMASNARLVNSILIDKYKRDSRN